MQKKICVFLDHDIIIRHFVLNHVLLPLENEYEVHYVFSDNPKRIKLDIKSLGLERVHQVTYNDERNHKYRILYQTTVLKKAQHEPEQHREMTLSFWRNQLEERAFNHRVKNADPEVFPAFKKKMIQDIGENPDLKYLLKEINPCLILHPTVLEGNFVMDLIRYGKKLDIPTFFIMNSWDNPATKAMVMDYPDWLAVWGEQTKRHAIDHMGIPEKQILCLGAAQFDVYSREPRISREAYRESIEFGVDDIVICYAGSSKGLNETRHLKMIEEAVEDGRLKGCKVLFRPHPWRAFPEEEEDFFAIDWKHIVMDPAMQECYRVGRDGGKMSVQLADYEDTHVVLNAVDGVISPLSTILLEAALHGKAIAAYLPDEDMQKNNFLLTTARMVHFTDFFGKVECIQCESPESLLDDIIRLKERTQEPDSSATLLKQCRFFVEPAEVSYAERLLPLLREREQQGGIRGMWRRLKRRWSISC